jgi:hypothetical protein
MKITLKFFFLHVIFACLFADEKLSDLQSLHTPDNEVPPSVLVHVVLDMATRQQLSPSSPDTNKHSLRSLWDENVDYWDIQANHSCNVKCTFDTSDESRVRANGILFSAQLFPAFSMFSDVMGQVCDPHLGIFCVTTYRTSCLCAYLACRSMASFGIY